MVDQLLALFRRGGLCIAGDALPIEVRHLPAEGVRAIGAQMGEAGGIIRLTGREVFGFRHVHPVGVKGQHDRGFDLAAMDADRLFLWRDHALG
ncbi:hypothetical protein D3C72_2358550 [compost metagenome]